MRRSEEKGARNKGKEKGLKKHKEERMQTSISAGDGTTQASSGEPIAHVLLRF